MFSLVPSTASTCVNRYCIFPPMPRNFFLAASTISPVTVAPLAMTIPSVVCTGALTVNRSGVPSVTDEETVRVVGLGIEVVAGPAVTAAGFVGGATGTGAGVTGVGVELE